MTTPNRANTLRRAYALLREGKPQEARDVLRPYLQANPNDADALTLASMLTDDPARKIELLRRALTADPFHARADAELQKLQAASKPQAAQHKTTREQPETAPQKKKNAGVLLIGVAVIMLVIVGAAVLLMSQLPQEADASIVPTLLVLDTLPPPSNTPVPQPTATETPVPTMTFTPAPFSYTATADWHLYQTEAAAFRVTLTAAALIP